VHRIQTSPSIIATPRFTIAGSLMPLVPRLLNEEISKNGLFWSPFLLPSAFYHDCRGGLE
jgi:hypothetical protein